MPAWEITEPRRLEIDEDVTHLDVSLFGGRLSVVGTDGPARVEVAASAGNGLLVTLDSGRLAVRQDSPKPWPGAFTPLWWWLRGRRTVSGALTADLDNPPHYSQLSLNTMSGELTIRVREDSDLTVDLTAAHGRVTSNFPGLSVEGRWGSAAHGVLGAGAGRLSANAMSGNTALLRRPVDPDFEAGQ